MKTKIPTKLKPTPAPLPPVDPRQRYTIDETARYLRNCRATIYKGINAGSIVTIRQGARRYVPGSEIVRLSSLPA